MKRHHTHSLSTSRFFAILCTLLQVSATHAFVPIQPKARVVTVRTLFSAPALTKLRESSVNTVDEFSCVDQTNVARPTQVNGGQPNEFGMKPGSIRTVAFAFVLGTTSLLWKKQATIVPRLLAFARSVSLFKVFGMTLMGSIIALFVWSKYSSITKASLAKGTFGWMELLSATREGYGNTTNIPVIAQRFREGTTEDLKDFVRLAGSHSTDKLTLEKESTIRIQGDLAVRCQGQQEWTLYGRREPEKLTLRELVAEKALFFDVEENLFKRMNWQKQMNDCVPDTSGTAKGSYRFCHRDYVNHEELMGMMWKRGGIENFMLKIGPSDVLEIDQDTKSCSLKVKSKMFRFIPITILWEGTLVDEGEGSMISWYTSSLTLGWKKFNKYFDKPPAAEKLRKDPWRITVPKSDSSGDIVCCNREWVGKLVFAKDECLSKVM